MFSSTPTGRQYLECEPDNPFLDFAPPTWNTTDGWEWTPLDTYRKSWSLSRYKTEDTFANSSHPPAAKQVEHEYTSQSTSLLPSSPTTTRRTTRDGTKQVLKWMFLFPYPQRGEDVVEKPKCDVGCRPHDLPGIMSAVSRDLPFPLLIFRLSIPMSLLQIGALHVGTAIKVHAGDFNSAITLKRILNVSAARYIASRRQYIAGLPLTRGTTRRISNPPTTIACKYGIRRKRRSRCRSPSRMSMSGKCRKRITLWRKDRGEMGRNMRFAGLWYVIRLGWDW